MNVLVDALISGFRRTQKIVGLKKINFLSKNGQKRRGVIRGMFSTRDLRVVQYVNDKGKARLAIVNKKKTAVEEELVYIAHCRKGSALSCICEGRSMNIVLLNERGEIVLNIGRRSTVLNQPIDTEETDKVKTNRQKMRKLMESKS